MVDEKNRLKKILESISSSGDYVIGIISILKTDENIHKMLSFIEVAGDKITPDIITLYALELNDSLKK